MDAVEWTIFITSVGGSIVGLVFLFWVFANTPTAKRRQGARCAEKTGVERGARRAAEAADSPLHSLGQPMNHGTGARSAHVLRVFPTSPQ